MCHRATCPGRHRAAEPHSRPETAAVHLEIHGAKTLGEALRWGSLGVVQIRQALLVLIISKTNMIAAIMCIMFQRFVAHLSATCRSSLSDSSLIFQRPSHRSYTSDSLVSAFACSDRLALSLVVYSLVERLGRWCKARGSTSHYLQHICLISFAHLHWGVAGRALGPPLIQRCRSVAVCLQTFLLICYPTCCTRAG
jgi:hypothetical protein